MIRDRAFNRRFTVSSNNRVNIKLCINTIFFSSKYISFPKNYPKKAPKIQLPSVIHPSRRKILPCDNSKTSLKLVLLMMFRFAIYLIEWAFERAYRLQNHIPFFQ